MDLGKYYDESDGNIRFTRQQSSDFARNEADDFNPIHDVDAKRFCVPGDLLFSVVLFRYGLSKTMRVQFSGMVQEGLDILMPASQANHISITDKSGREYLSFDRSGESAVDPDLIDKLASAYVAYSGHSFTHVMVPLMAANHIMINPDRPMVMYESMLIELDSLHFSELKLVPNQSKTKLQVNGKRANGKLAFDLVDRGTMIGRGEKHILLSGIRDYDQAAMQGIQDQYEARKRVHLTT